MQHSGTWERVLDLGYREHRGCGLAAKRRNVAERKARQPARLPRPGPPQFGAEPGRGDPDPGAADVGDPVRRFVDPEEVEGQWIWVAAAWVGPGLDGLQVLRLTQAMRALAAYPPAIQALLDEYAKGELSTVYIAYTRFENTMRQESVIEQLLPLSVEKMQQETRDSGTQHSWDYIYEPDAQSVIDDLLVRYVEALVYQAVAENMASEQSARMVAMKAATDNAGNVINELKLVYNKTRQAAITTELSEIVAGAAAV